MQYWWGERRLEKIPKKQYTQKQAEKWWKNTFSHFLFFPFLLYFFPFFHLCSWIFERIGIQTILFFFPIFSSILLFIRIIKMELLNLFWTLTLGSIFGIDILGSILVLSKKSVLVLSKNLFWFFPKNLFWFFRGHGNDPQSCFCDTWTSHHTRFQWFDRDSNISSDWSTTWIHSYETWWMVSNKNFSALRTGGKERKICNITISHTIV